MSPEEEPAARPASPGREYLRRRERRQGPWRAAAIALVALGTVTAAVYYGENARPSSGAGSGAASSGRSGPSAPASGSPVNITFGAARVSSVTCGDGRSTTAVELPWIASSPAVETDAIFLELTETLDGDVDGGPGPTPAINATSDCLGGPPSVAPNWYAVLEAPAGRNLAVYGYGLGWIFVNDSLSSVPIAPGSTIVFLSDPSYAGYSFALCVFGAEGHPYFEDCATL